MSFEHPGVGNVLERDLLELWNSEPFVSTPGESICSRPCGPGTLTCPGGPGPEAW